MRPLTASQAVEVLVGGVRLGDFCSLALSTPRVGSSPERPTRGVKGGLSVSGGQPMKGWGLHLTGLALSGSSALKTIWATLVS